MRDIEMLRALRCCVKCHNCHSSVTELCPMCLEFDSKTYSTPGVWNTAEMILCGDLQISADLAVVPFACTTCGACSIKCPTLDLHKIYPYPTELIEAVRGMFVENGAIPGKITEVLANFETTRNAWRLPPNRRVDWEKDCDFAIDDFRKTKNEYLLFVGDASLIQETRHIAKSVASLLRKGGVDFGTLKEQEVDSGNEVRALGERGLFEDLAAENIETFRRYGVKKVITLSPHDYQAFTHDYAKLGMQFDGVYHYSQLIAELIDLGKISLTNKLDKTVTFQDPCHLGRFNKVYDAPRQIIKSIPGVSFVEMFLNSDFAMCCGAGGGRMWYEHETGRKQRIADARIGHAKDVGADVVATACPYCLSNLKGCDTGGIQVADISELILENVLGPS